MDTIVSLVPVLEAMPVGLLSVVLVVLGKPVGGGYIVTTVSAVSVFETTVVGLFLVVLVLFGKLVGGE